MRASSKKLNSRSQRKLLCVLRLHPQQGIHSNGEESSPSIFAVLTGSQPAAERVECEMNKNLSQSAPSRFLTFHKPPLQLRQHCCFDLPAQWQDSASQAG